MKRVMHNILLLFILFIVFAAGYSGAQILRPEGLLVNTFLDDYIPFLDFFVVLYLLHYPFLLLPFVLVWKDRLEFNKVFLGYLFVILISVAIFLTIQTQVVREDTEPTNVFRWLVLDNVGL